MCSIPTFPKRGEYPNILKSGVAPTLSEPTITSSYRSLNRDIVTRAWNSAFLVNKTKKGQCYGNIRKIGAFRVVNNAGDVLSRENYSCGGPNMVTPNSLLANMTWGGGQSRLQCDGSGIPPSTCNVKYVYDSSDYTTYLKQQATNKDMVAPNFTDGGSTTNYSGIRIKKKCQRECPTKKRMPFWSVC